MVIGFYMPKNLDMCFELTRINNMIEIIKWRKGTFFNKKKLRFFELYLKMHQNFYY